MHPGDRVVISCHADDPHGRELRWWLHPFNRPRGGQVRGSTVELAWHVHPASVGDRVYLGIGMAAQSRYHRYGGRDEQGYDGWLVCYYPSPPTRPVHPVLRYPSNARPTDRNEPD